MDQHAEALADMNVSLELVGMLYKALHMHMCVQVVLEDYQVVVNGFRASLENVDVDGSQVEEHA